jgi:sigma-B regulation protein RsbU (phosphoserine phosphatase)
MAAVGLAASIVPAWRATLVSPLVAIRNEPESLWQAARQRMRGIVGQLAAPAADPAVPIGTLITEFAGYVRRADSFPAAIQEALGTLRARVNARSALLLERAPGDVYRSGDVSLPAEGFLLRRLRSYPHPLTLTASDLDAWRRWAGDRRRAHAAEIEAIAGTGARVAVALRTKNEIVGVLLVGPPDEREAYTAGEKQVLAGSADMLALLIENARLTERTLEQEKVRRDLALAAEVQKRLLPAHPPRSEAAAFAALTIAARTVGGDYYDFLELPGGRVGVAIADVAGKGIAAALLMSVVQASLRVIASEGGLAPSELAAKMNRLLFPATGGNKYATFFYAEIDADGRGLRYVNAGHNPPYVLRHRESGIEVGELRAGGTVIGLFPEAEYEQAEIRLQPGDLLVAFTDGVTEALSAGGEEFGEERLQATLREAAAAPADSVAATVASRLQQWTAGAEQHDDLTVVVVAPTPAGRHS